MQRKKILWLVSWYPNKNDRFDGDFIQRHARAAAIYHDVHVIFVTDADIEKTLEEELNYATGLTEQTIYFKRKSGLAARLRKQLTWKRLYQEAVKKYIAKNALPDIVHVHIPWKTGIIALWIKKNYRKDFIITEHWGIYNQNNPENFFIRPKITQRLIKDIYKKAKAYTTVSNVLAKDIKDATGKECSMIIPNVVDTTLFFPKAEKYSKFTFIHVSNMVDLKNVESILDAFKEVVENTTATIQLLMIGNKNGKYPGHAQKLGLLNSSVFFRGEVTYREVAEEMKRSHCLILFSDTETFSCVTAEALCSGLPVIASRVGALPELIHNTNGILVPPNDIRALAHSIKQIVETYSSFHCQQIAENASQKFSYSTVAEQFGKLYDSLT